MPPRFFFGSSIPRPCQFRPLPALLAKNRFIDNGWMNQLTLIGQYLNTHEKGNHGWWSASCRSVRVQAVVVIWIAAISKTHLPHIAPLSLPSWPLQGSQISEKNAFFGIWLFSLPKRSLHHCIITGLDRPYLIATITLYWNACILVTHLSPPLLSSVSLHFTLSLIKRIACASPGNLDLTTTNCCKRGKNALN